MDYPLLFLLGFILVFADVFTMVVVRWKKIPYTDIAEFASGLFTAFVFLQFLPELFTGQYILGEAIFLFIFLGFSVFFLFEKFYACRGHIEKSKAIVSANAPVYYVEFFIEGMAIFFFLHSRPFLPGLLLLGPFILSTVSASLALTELYKKFYKSLLVDIFFDAYPLLGILYASMIFPFHEMFYSAFAFVAGAFLYIIIKRTSRIKRVKGIKLFVSGMIVCIAVIYF